MLNVNISIYWIIYIYIINLNTNIIMTNQTQCDYNSFHLLLPKNKCQFAIDNCNGAYFNMISFNYCEFENNYLLSILIYSILSSISFYIIFNTANDYLSSSLTKISYGLGLSPNISALTLLAFGNGAPDVISAFVASEDSEGLLLGIGALFGSGLILTTISFSLVIYMSTKKIKLKPMMYKREILVYLVSLSLLGIFGLDGKIELWEAIIFLSIYLFNIILAVIIEKAEKRKGRNPIKQVFVDGKEMKSNIEKEFELEVKNERKSSIEKLDEETNGNFDNNTSIDMTDNSKVEDYIEDIVREVEMKEDENVYRIKNKIEISEKEIYRIKINNRVGILFRIKHHYFSHIGNYNTLSLERKILYILIEFPLTLLRDISIPNTESQHYHKYKLIVSPIFSIIIFLLFTNTWKYIFQINNQTYKFIVIGIIIIVPLIVSVILFIILKNKSDPPKTYLPFCFANFIMSLVWIYASSNIIINSLQFFIILTGVDQAVIGLTVLALSNCTQDLVLNCSLSRKGYGEMAVGGSFAGPLFNLVVGLGISLIKISSLQGKSIKFNFFCWENKWNVIAYFALIINLIIGFIVCVKTKYVLSRFNIISSMIIIILFIFVLGVLYVCN